MKTINRKYSIPGNYQELEGLVGKPISLKIESESPSFGVVYLGTNGFKHKFVRQSMTHTYLNGNFRTSPNNLVVNYECLVEDIKFSNEGVIIPSLPSFIHSSTNKSRDYKLANYAFAEGQRTKLSLLKSNNLWRDTN